MLIKIILEYLKNSNYQIVQDNITTIITAVHIETGTIVTHTVTGRTMIAIRTDTDIRYAGLIENLQQLKVILRLIRDLPVK